MLCKQCTEIWNEVVLGRMFSWLACPVNTSCSMYSSKLAAPRCSRHHSLDTGALSSGDYSPPKSLEEVVREKRAYRRELHTVNVGRSRLAAIAAVTKHHLISCSATRSCWRIRSLTVLVWDAAIGTNFAIFLAKLGVFTFTGSK